MARGLTQRQQDVLEFISEYIMTEGYPPSIREIGDAFKIGSLRGVTVHLDALQKKGYITRSKLPRSIKVIHPAFQPSENVLLLPLLGDIAAGAPIHAQEDIQDMIPIPQQMVRNIENAFILRVKGDSMTGEGILPRDLVVVRPQEHANHGELVAVLVEDEATVKRIHFEQDRVRLMPSNPSYEPIELHESDQPRILGRIIGVLRDYEGMAF